MPNDLIRDCLCDYGVWLEIYMYGVMKASGVFDGARLSAVVRGEDEKAVNELDVRQYDRKALIAYFTRLGKRLQGME